MELSCRERMKRMYEHQEADRVPILTGPWESTIARWRREGLPADVPIDEYLGIDRLAPADGARKRPRPLPGGKHAPGRGLGCWAIRKILAPARPPRQ